MRLNAIIPVLGMVALFVCPIFAGNGGSASPTNPFLANSTVADFEKNLGHAPAENTAAVALAITETHVNATCNAASSGAITVTVTGFTIGSSMTFTLSGTNYLGAAVNSSVTESNTDGIRTFTNLKAGTYNVTATTSGMPPVSVTNIIIKQPPAPSTPSTLVTSPLCAGTNNGKIKISQAFGAAIPPYTDPALISSVTFRLTSGPGVPPGGFTMIDNTAPYEQEFTGLAPGIYTATVRANNCSVTTLSGIVVTAATPVNASVIGTTGVTCFNSSNGEIEIGASGGTAPYTANWGGGASPTFTTSHEFTGLAAGSYSITVSDANMCTTVVTASVSTPTPVAASGSSTPVTCNGGTNGTATFSATGGTPAMAGYTFHVTGQTDQTDNSLPYEVTYTGLASGTYSCTVTDANGCTFVTSATVGQPVNPLTITSTVNNVTCNGGNSGSIVPTAAGGTGPYNYDWADVPGASNTKNRFFLSAGTYTLTVTDANMCTAEHIVMVTQPLPLTVTGTDVDILCNGANTGSIDITAAGGTPGYTYNWSNIPGLSNPEDQTGLAPGTYSVTVIDANLCTANTSFTITEPTALVLTPMPTDETCATSDDGTFGGSVSGGVGPYLFTLSPDPNNDGGVEGTSCLFENLPGAVEIPIGFGGVVYTLTATDENGCTVEYSSPIFEPELLEIGFTTTDALCFGSNNGEVTISGTGGTLTMSTPDYVYEISGTDYEGNPISTITDPSGVFSNLLAGNYTATITDANGCTATTSFSIGQFPALLIDNIEFTLTDCDPPLNVNIQVHASGGTPAIPDPYMYEITGYATQNTGNFGGLMAGMYTATVTDGAGCTATKNFGVNSLAFTAIVSNPATCYGGDQGEIEVTYSGGSGQGVYLDLYDQYNNLVESLFDIDGFHLFGSLEAGDYTVEMNDYAFGCSISEIVTVGQPDQILVETDNSEILCYGGSSTITFTAISGGGGPDYYYEGIVPVLITPGVTSFTSPAGDPMDNYFIQATVSDVNGCTQAFDIYLPEPDELIASASVSATNCIWTITASQTGGTAPFEYSFDGGMTYSSTATMSPATAGTHTVWVKDFNGCTDDVEIEVEIPDMVTLATSHTNVSCFGGSNGTITPTASNGAAPFTYTLTGYTFNSMTGQFSGLAMGSYTVTVTDANGCSATSTANITQPTLLTATGTSTNITCFGASNGSINLTVAGGTTAYNYDWADVSGTSNTEDRSGLAPGSYSVTVTDGNMCTATYAVTVTEPALLAATGTSVNVSCFGGNNGSINLTASGGTSPYNYDWADLMGTNNPEDRSGLIAGNYSVLVSDANSCSATYSVTITQPAAISITGTPTNVTCNGANNGSIDLNVTGGMGGFTYDWADVTGTSNSEDRIGLAPGSYSVTVTDVNMCTASYSVMITQPAVLSATGVAANVSCFGANDGSINLTVAGGTSPYMTDWSDVAGTANSEDRSGLAPGTYVVFVTDANSCTATYSVTITQPTALTATGTTVNVSCFGGNNGSINLTASGGTAPYSYDWADVMGTNDSEDRTGLTAGTYSVLVTDDNACSVSYSVTITQPAAVSVTGTTVNVSCFGGNNGSINVTATGGTSPYNYDWADVVGTNNSEDRTGLVQGSYTVTVSDINSCSAIYAVTITQPAILTATGTSTNVTCFGANDGSINLTASGGTTAYNYDWADVAGTNNTEDRSGLAPGTYSVTVTDANLCTATYSVTITQPAAIVLTETHVNLLCFGASNGSIDLSVSSGTFTYDWSNDGPDMTDDDPQDLSGLPAGTYTVTVTDGSGCTATTSVTITQPTEISIALSAVNGSGCTQNGTVTAAVTGGSPAYSYLWSGGAGNTPQVSPPTGSYSVTVMDALGCTKTAGPVSVTQPVLLNTTETHVNASCGFPNGTITLSPTGGTSPYSFTLNGGPSQTSNTFTGLAANTYNVIVTDAGGCTKAISVVITQTGSSVAVATQLVHVLCNGNSTGSITATASNGTAPYTYRIGTGAFSPNNLFQNLAAGTYTVEASDVNGCTATTTVTITQPSVLGASAVASSASCFGQSNGSITVTATGGTSAYMYKIGNGAFQTGNVFTNLAAGTYVIVVKDANGCEKSVQATVQQPSVLNVNATAVDVTCNGLSDGKIGVSATGGTPAYMYQLNNGAFQTSNQFTNLAAATYTITVKDANGCTATTTATVNQPQAGPLGIALDQVLPVTCLSNGAILVTVTGCGPFTYTWTKPNGDVVGNTEDLVNVPAGTYNLLVIDGGGMTTTLTGTIVPTAPLNIQGLTVENNTTCAVTISWTATSNTDGYEVRFKPCNATVWTTFPGITTTSYTFTGLSPLTCYDFCVRYKKDPCFGDWTCVTGSVTPEFNPPVNTSSTVNSNTSATIKWAQSNCGGQAPNNVELRFHKVGVTSWTVMTLSGSAVSQTLNSLMPNTCYEYRLRNKFIVAGVTKWSNFTLIKQFCLPLNVSGGNGTELMKQEDEIISIEYDVIENEDLVEQPTRDIAVPTLDFTLFPNPTSDFVNLRFSSIDEANSLTIKLLSLSGQLISQQTILDPTGIADQQMDVNPLPQGFYLIEVSNGALRRVEKFVKQ